MEKLLDIKAIEFTDVCRFCLKISNDKTRDFSDDSLDLVQLPNVYRLLTGQKLNIFEGHSNLICSLCEQQIKHFDQFRRELLKVHYFWASIVLKKQNLEATHPIEHIILPEHIKVEENLTTNEESEELVYEEVEYLEDINEFERIDTVLDDPPNWSDSTGGDGSLINNDMAGAQIFKSDVSDKCHSSKNALKTHASNECERVGTVLDDPPHWNDIASADESLKNDDIVETWIDAKMFTCDVCDKSYSSKTALKTHLSKHTSNEHSETCEICGKTNLKRLDEHLRDHSNVGRFKCSVCDKGFARKVHARYHMRIHTGERPFICHVCSFPFATSTSLSRHVKTHNPSSSVNHRPRSIPKSHTLFKCTHCDIEFSVRRSLRSHMIENHGIYLNPIKPEVKTSKKSYRKANPLIRIQRLQNYNAMENRTLQCPVCTRSNLKNRNQLRVHLFYEHETNALIEWERIKKTVCAVCNRVFADSTELAEHKSAVHLTFQCDICKRFFDNKKTLEFHIQSHSTRHRPHQCQVCGAKYLYRSNLSYHFRKTHTNERNYACDVCSKAFGHRSELLIHKRSHSDVRALKCYYCPKTYKDTNMLLKHIKRHTGDFRYKCTVCKGVFMSGFDLTEHMDMAHSET